jgi:hypothetical protein
MVQFVLAYMRACYRAPSRPPRIELESPGPPLRTRCVIVSRLTCSNPVPTYAPCRSCSVTRMFHHHDLHPCIKQTGDHHAQSGGRRGIIRSVGATTSPDVLTAIQSTIRDPQFAIPSTGSPAAQMVQTDHGPIPPLHGRAAIPILLVHRNRGCYPRLMNLKASCKTLPLAEEQMLGVIPLTPRHQFARRCFNLKA